MRYSLRLRLHMNKSLCRTVFERYGRETPKLVRIGWLVFKHTTPQAFVALKIIVFK